MSIHMYMLERNEFRMEIKRIKLDGYKNVTDVDLQLSKITGLLSINSFGKSNVLNGIDFGFKFISAQSKYRSKLMMGNNGMPLFKNNNKNYTFEIEFVCKMDKKPFDVIYGYEFRWGNQVNKSGKIINEYLKLKDVLESQKYSSYIERDETKSLYKSSLTGRCNTKLTIDNNELIINKLKAYDNLFYIDLLKALNEIEFYIDRHFDASDFYDTKSILSKQESKNPMDEFYDLGANLYSLKKAYLKDYNLIINTIKDLFPFIQEIEVNEIIIKDENHVYVGEGEYFHIDFGYVIYATQANMKSPIKFSNMSDGVKRILLILTYMTLAKIRNIPIIAIEEPENSINPGLLRKLLIVLDNFAENSKVIITSHSPFLINYFNLSSLYLGLPNKEGRGTFKKLKKTSYNRIENTADELNMLNGEYLFDIMSGSDDDVEELRNYLEND